MQKTRLLRGGSFALPCSDHQIDHRPWFRGFPRAIQRRATATPFEPTLPMAVISRYWIELRGFRLVFPLPRIAAPRCACMGPGRARAPLPRLSGSRGARVPVDDENYWAMNRLLGFGVKRVLQKSDTYTTI